MSMPLRVTRMKMRLPVGAMRARLSVRAMRTRLPVALLTATLCLSAAAGCGPATFVSAEPPPDTKADAWFTSPLPRVESALRQAMVENGLSPRPGDGNGVVLVGTKQQLPYVDEESGEPASGPLPVYRLRATLTRSGQTHVRVILRAECAACDGQTPYEWQYPGDIVRAVVDRTRSILREKRARLVYPARYRPVPWHRPVRR